MLSEKVQFLYIVPLQSKIGQITNKMKLSITANSILFSGTTAHYSEWNKCP